MTPGGLVSDAAVVTPTWTSEAGGGRVTNHAGLFMAGIVARMSTSTATVGSIAGTALSN